MEAIRHRLPIGIYWYGLYWKDKVIGVVGPYLNRNECVLGLDRYGLTDSIPISFPSRNLFTLVTYLKDNGIVN